MLLQAFTLAAALAAIPLSSAWSRWDMPMTALITCLAVGSDITLIETGSQGVKVSGAFLGMTLAAILLGGGPAEVVGITVVTVGWFRSREVGHYYRNNLVSYAVFPLVGGLFFHGAIRLAHADADDAAYYLLVFLAFVVALSVNFLTIAGYQCYLERSRLVVKVQEALLPVLSSELFSAMLTLAAVFVAVHSGTIGLALFALILVLYQYLATELLISRHRRQELRRIATTDELTGLSNRERFNQRVGEAIAECGASGRSFAVMLMDLDRFKEINDTLGHHYGDELLREVGPRLGGCVGSGGLVARLGGDEFAVLAPAIRADAEELGRLASGLLAAVSQPLVVDELSLEVGASLGIARFPVDGEDPHTLLRHADIAMYAAKARQSGYRVYEPELNHHSVRRLSVLTDFRRALRGEEIVVYFQPIVDLADRRVSGAEALVRWEHPELGLLPPAAFLPLVEQTPMIGPLTRHVLERSIAQCARWRRAGHDLSVAVNLSVRNLLDRDLPETIERMLNAYGLPPRALQLEITESMIMSEPDRAGATVALLSDLGLRLSVDDFGTGYSSLANLRRLPIDELKIDRSFVTPMLEDESDLIIVSSTINLGHDLGLKIIAEGVEDAGTLEKLGRLGCDLVQGYHVSRPLAAEAFVQWVADRLAEPVRVARAAVNGAAGVAGVVPAGGSSRRRLGVAPVRLLPAPAEGT